MIRPEDSADLQRIVQDWVWAKIRVDSVEEAERVGREVAQVVGAVVVEEALRQVDGEESYQGCSRECECGRKARFMGYRKRGLSTLCGVVEVTRAYYHCRHCGEGQIPWDTEQGLTTRLWTAGVKAVVAEVAARLPYQETAKLLEDVLGLRVEESSAEVIVAEVGERARAAEEEAMAEVSEGQLVGPRGPVPKRLYVAMDGSHAHVDGAWHEIKTGVVYEGVPGPRGVDASGPKHYVSAQETAESFGDRLYVAAGARGVEQAEEVVVIGDGAEWIWNLAAHHYPKATEIVDYWHACEHIHDLAKVCYGEETKAGERWAKEHDRRLKEKGPCPLVRALRRRKAKTPQEAEEIQATLRYFTTHIERMRYPEFRQRGLMIGSGPVEAACKVVVGYRLKQAGMRWSQSGAHHVLALRCLVLNRQSDDIRRFARAA